MQAILTARIDRLPADEKDLLQTLAVIGREFALGLLHSVAAKSEDELNRMLHALQLAEFIYEQPAVSDIEYTFKHALTQEVAYNSVLTERRRMLHGRIGAALENLRADRLEDHLPQLAHHFARSADTAKAVEYMLKAGQSAAQRSASREALERFEAGLTLLESLPARPAHDQQELAIRVAMWLPLVEERGFAAVDIELNLKRARELCDQTGAPTALIRQVLSGLWVTYNSTARFEMARSLAGQLLALGQERDDDIARLTGYIAIGATCHITGEQRAAATSLGHGIAICERLLAGCPDPIVMTDLVSACLHLTPALWILGYTEQALRQIDRMQALPERLDSRYAFDHATAIYTDLSLRFRFLRDYHVGREKAEALIALARENRFSYFEALGPVYLGRIEVQDGALDEGISVILQAREALGRAGEILTFQVCTWLLADAYLTARRPAEGLAAVDEAIAAADQLQMRYYEAEVHRLKGELLLLAGAPESEAEASMRRAVAIAQRQEAKGWELRAATSLARLLRKQGRIGEARDVLAPVYNWFTEGFDTFDLKDAKALLEELGV